MPILNAGIAIGDRIEPTPEDMAIIQRNFTRLNRWRTMADCRGIAALGVFRNACDDYLHFPPNQRRPDE